MSALHWNIANIAISLDRDQGSSNMTLVTLQSYGYRLHEDILV